MHTTRPVRLAILCLMLAAASIHGADGDPSEPVGGSSLDGHWQAWYTKNQSEAYAMEFADGTFHAVHDEQWYRGDLVLDVEAAPARIDFTIRECECGFAGKTSTGIFRWDGNEVEIRAPEPGKPRPTEFDEKSSDTFRLVRRSR